jgi:outer membrane receptor protein involved in Fe transport
LNRIQSTFLTLLLVLGFVIGGSYAGAQTSLGILVGVVRDSTGAVVPHAVVTIKGEQSGETRKLTTQADGSYRIEALRPEQYTLTATEQGFTTFQVTHIVVNPSVVTSYDVNLTIGATKDTVSVEANSIGINTENGQLAALVSNKEIAELPIFSLNPVELATTLPGVQMVDQSGFSNGINIQVNGARPRSNNFLLDGQEINDVAIGGQAFQPAIPDMYDQLTVITSSGNAEYGRAGGGIVNYTTKAGTNVFHGSVFERYTGSGLNAQGGNERGQGITKSRFDQHNYGFTAGGPVIKDKLFAFGGLQLTRFFGKETPAVLELPDAAGVATLNAIAAANPTSAPQVALLSKYLSAFSYLGAGGYNPLTGNGVALINVAGQPTAACPAATVPGTCQVEEAFYQRPAVNANSPDTQWTYRIDYKPWEKDSFTARYIHDRGSLNPDFFNNAGALVGFDTLQGGPSELGEGVWTHIFTSHLLNEFRVAETRLSFEFAPTPQTLANPLNSLPTYSISSVPALGPNQNFPQGRGEELYQFQDTVGWTIGRHSIRAGVDIGRQLETDLISQNAIGTIGFAKGGSGNTSLGNFLLNQTGPSGSVTKTFGKTRIDPHDWRSAVFFQDDIKLNADLTLNVGVRYDYLTNPENSLPLPAVDPNNVFAPINTVLQVQNDKNNISPRFGFAYSPHFGGYFGDGKTVVRGGFGIFYDSDFSNFVTNSAQSSPNAIAFSDVVTTGNGVANPSAALATAVAVLSPQSAVESVATNMVNPETYQYNLGVERQLPGNVVLAVRYVGDRGEHLFANQQYNYFNGLTGTRLNTTRNNIVLRQNSADSNYNSLQIEASHGFSHGFLIRTNYTYGKDLDDGSEIFTTFATPTSYSANLAPGGRIQDWGPSAYDHRQYLSIAYVWQPSGLHSENKIANAALGALTRHWTISGIEQFQSGPYSTFNMAGVDSNGDGSTANDRPIIGNASLPLFTAGIDGIYLGAPTSGTYYDMKAANAGILTPVTAAQEHFLIPYGPGNQFLKSAIGRNSFKNPGLQFHNIAIEKGIGASWLHLERGQFVVRVEAQNLGNHNNRGPLDSNLLDIADPAVFATSTNTDQLGREDAGRQLVLWGKFTF